MSSKVYDEHYYEKMWRTESGSLRWEDPAQQYDLNLKLNNLEHFFRYKGKVLFVGTAKGFEIRMARQRGWEAFGTDFSEYAISHCDPTIKDFIQLADSRNLPFPDDSFDVVAGFNTVEHTGRGKAEEVSLALKEASRVAKDGLLFKVAIKHWAVTHYLDPALIELQPLLFWIEGVERLGKHRFFHAEIGPAPLHTWIVYYCKEKWKRTLGDSQDTRYLAQQIENAIKKV